MRLLYLGPHRQHMIDDLRSFGDEVIHMEEHLTDDSEILEGVDFLVSYGYKHILKDHVLSRFPRRVVNMHISFLPWNRGTHPNMWSFLEDTPKGVTIHQIDAGIDTGDILAQEEVHFGPDETLRSTYAILSETIEALFTKIWPTVRLGEQPSVPQPSGGSFHYARDKKKVDHLLTKGWDTPVVDLIGRASEVTSGKQ